MEAILGMTVDPEDPARLEFERLLRTATEDFDRHGWKASIPRMAARLKRSKSVFDHYAVDKEALLYLCYDRGQRLLEISQRIAAANATHAVEEIVLSYVYRYRAHGSWLGPLPPAHTRGAFAPQHKRIIDLRNHSLRYRAQRRVERAIDEGWLRDVDPYIVQLFAAMLHRLGSSYETAEATHLEDIAHENLRLVFDSPPLRLRSATSCPHRRPRRAHAGGSATRATPCPRAMPRASPRAP